MRLLILWVLFTLITATGIAQVKLDTTLQRKIKAMFREDQKWRMEYNKLSSGKKSEYDEATINHNMEATDSLNLIMARQIISRYGFPGYSLAGESGSTEFWAIVQHCDSDLPFQRQVLALMTAQVVRHNASAEDCALLQDRVLVSEGQKQIYGTQVRYNPKTHQTKPYPIRDSLHVDERRKAVGMPTLKEYLKTFEMQ